MARFDIKEIMLRDLTDSRGWAEFVLGETEIPALFFYPQFLKIVYDTLEKIRLYGVTDNSRKAMVGGFVIKERRRYGLTIGELPTFCMSNFFVLEDNSVSDQRFKIESYYRNLFNEIADFLIKRYDKVSLISSNFLFDTRPFQWKGFQDSASYNYQTDVSKNFNGLNQYRGSTQRQIKKCIRNRLIVQTEVLPGCFYDLWYTTNMVKGRKTAFSRPKIVNFIQSMQKTGLAEIYGVFDDSGNVHAAALIGRDETTGYYLMGGSDVKLRKSGAASLLHHEIMVDLRDKNFKFYDWFGGNTPEIVRFKIGFNPTLRTVTKIAYSNGQARFYKWVQDGKNYILRK